MLGLIELRRGRRLGDVLERDADRGLGVEGNPAGEHLVEHDADRVQVRAGVDGVALSLLGREVLGGAHDRAGLGHVRRAGAGDAEVRDLGMTRVVDDHVVRLQIAVDHPTAVREPRRLEDLDGDIDRAQRVQRRLLADQLLERAPRQVLHGDVVGVVERPAVIDADDVGVLEAGRGLGLAAEALDEVGVLGEAVMQQLERDLAAELLILGQEHIGHSSRTQSRHHPVATIDDRVRDRVGHQGTLGVGSGSTVVTATCLPTAAPGRCHARSGRPPVRRTRPASSRW